MWKQVQPASWQADAENGMRSGRGIVRLRRPRDAASMRTLACKALQHDSVLLWYLAETYLGRIFGHASRLPAIAASSLDCSAHLRTGGGHHLLDALKHLAEPSTHNTINNMLTCLRTPLRRCPSIRHGTNMCSHNVSSAPLVHHLTALA